MFEVYRRPTDSPNSPKSYWILWSEYPSECEAKSRIAREISVKNGTIRDWCVIETRSK